MYFHSHRSGSHVAILRKRWKMKPEPQNQTCGVQSRRLENANYSLTTETEKSRTPCPRVAHRRASGPDERAEYSTPPVRPTDGGDPPLRHQAMHFLPVIFARTLDKEAGEQDWGSGCMGTSSSKRHRAPTPDHLLRAFRALAVTQVMQPENSCIGTISKLPDGNAAATQDSQDRTQCTAWSQGSPHFASLRAQGTNPGSELTLLRSRTWPRAGQCALFPVSQAVLVTHLL